MQITQRAGLAAIVGLMAVALFNDLSRLFGG
jgi:membrane-associated protease RseP (regulator of RpoE activity)